MELTDLMPIEKCRQLAEDIYKRFGFNGAVYDKNNNVVVQSEGWANKICPAIKSGDSRIICASAQQRLSKKAQGKREPAAGDCEIGLVKFVVPIFVNDEFVGSVGGCGCVLEDSEVDEFYIGKLLKKEEGETEGLLTTVHNISQDKLEEAIRYVQKKVRDSLN